MGRGVCILEAAVGVPVLHCYADHKWTGPSEPVAQLCLELSRRGWPSDLACRGSESPDRPGLARRARQMGVRVFDDLRLRSGLNAWRHVRDARRLARLVREGGYRIVHCHGTWDHVVAYLALRRLAGILLVRTDHRGRTYRRSLLRRLFYGPPVTDHLIVLSDRYRIQAVDRMGLAPSMVTTIRGAVNTDEFRPVPERAGVRERFGLGPEDVLIGVVARVQRHRRFEVLLEAARAVQGRNGCVKIIVCGRGTHREELLDRPVREMGLRETVIPLGYRRGDYREVLSMFDAGLMLMPGSDGSCRAALQMAAMGKPLIVARRGVLPDIVLDGETGIVVDDTPGALAEAILQIAGDAALRRRWGQAARQRMCQRFSLAGHVDDTVALYERLLGEEPASRA